MRIYNSFLSVTICSAVLSVICALAGILISILAGTPVGSTIVAIDVLAFACWRLHRRKDGVVVAPLSSLRP